MLKRTKIVSLLEADQPIEKVLVKGWVRTRRDAKDFSFIELNDGSSLKNIQIIANNNLSNYEEVKKITTGSSLAVTGALVDPRAAIRNMKLLPEKLKFILWHRMTSPAEKETHRRIFADDCSSAAAHQQIRCGFPCSFGIVFCHTQIF